MILKVMILAGLLGRTDINYNHTHNQATGKTHTSIAATAQSVNALLDPPCFERKASISSSPVRAQSKIVAVAS